MAGKRSKSLTKPKNVYIYLVPRAKWPKHVCTLKHRKNIFVDLDNFTGETLGFEFLDCYGVEVTGKDIFRK